MGRATTKRHGEPSRVVAVGASAGGVEALIRLAAGLPGDSPCALLVVLHMPPGAPSVLANIIDRSGPLLATAAIDGTPLKRGRIYVAVPDKHLLVHDGRVALSNGPTENGYRPAINALFRSVALAHCSRAVGVLLSGVLDDGVLGLAAIRSRGGTTVVQKPSDALFSAMPHNAIDAGVADYQAAAADIGELLAQLADHELEDLHMTRDKSMELENRIAMRKRFTTSSEIEELGPPSGYVCPDCNGSLQAVGDGSFRCQVGHAWTAEALLQARDQEVEGALWVAIRSLQEKGRLARRMADNVGHGPMYQRYCAMAGEAEHAVAVLGEHLSEAYGAGGERGAG